MSEVPVATFAAATNADWRAEVEVSGDLTGAELRMELRENADERAVALVLSSANGRLEIAGDGSTVEISVPAEAMARVRPGTYVHDLRAERDGEVWRVWTGTASVERGVTRG